MCIKNIYKLIFGLLVALMIALPEMSYSQSSGNVTVSGTITSADDGEPLIGVSVVSDSFQGVTSSIDGTYTIEVKGGSVLTFSYLGFKSVEYKVPSDNKTVTYNLSMESESESIDDVVVIAYGVRKKGTVAGSVSSV